MTEEQKAEEYAKNILKDVTCNIGHPRARQINSIDIQDAWLDGYHEYQKEHEWHYPSKGELPKDEKEVLVYMWGSFYIGSYKQYTDDNNAWHFNDFDEESEQITAWKEIVLPKEIE